MWAEHSLSEEGPREHVKGVPDGTGKYLAARESTGHRKDLARGRGCELIVLSSGWIAREEGQGLKPTGTQRALLQVVAKWFTQLCRVASSSLCNEGGLD